MFYDTPADVLLNESWEYAELTYSLTDRTYVLNIYGTQSSETVEIHCEPEKGDFILDDARNRTIAEMGVDGWELVNVVPTGMNTGLADAHAGVTLYFKRIIEPDE